MHNWITQKIDQLQNIFSSNKKDDSSPTPDLSSLKVVELKDMARSRGMKGYSKLNKAQLVSALHEAPLP